MNELEKLNLEYMEKRLTLQGDEKLIELKGVIVKANADLLEYLKTEMIQEIK